VLPVPGLSQVNAGVFWVIGAEICNSSGRRRVEVVSLVRVAAFDAQIFASRLDIVSQRRQTCFAARETFSPAWLIAPFSLLKLWLDLFVPIGFVWI
jgi:hypothetical protein